MSVSAIVDSLSTPCPTREIQFYGVLRVQSNKSYYDLTSSELTRLSLRRPLPLPPAHPFRLRHAVCRPDTCPCHSPAAAPLSCSPGSSVGPLRARGCVADARSLRAAGLRAQLTVNLQLSVGALGPAACLARSSAAVLRLPCRHSSPGTSTGAFPARAGAYVT